MDETLGKIFSAAAGLWALVLVNAVALYRAWPQIMARINERHRDREAEKSGDWSRLRAEIVRLDERCDHLQTAVDECREREADWMSRAISAEAVQLGQGEAMQQAQRIVSAERIKPDKPSNGGTDV